MILFENESFYSEIPKNKANIKSDNCHNNKSQRLKLKFGISKQIRKMITSLSVNEKENCDKKKRESES